MRPVSFLVLQQLFALLTRRVVVTDVSQTLPVRLVVHSGVVSPEKRQNALVTPAFAVASEDRFPFQLAVHALLYGRDIQCQLELDIRKLAR
ncbi:hypothetical protein C9940_03300 [Pseudidiomarina aestuarii]|uniref:Uncharacterized protein n=1 Tax=Pseudidiomarina aestuarii TaxID=624146 RepID=A0A2T4D4U9_9GAMM|nr:hypothetical protein C9940_03300 [Pseudidiomarina aestuarii]PTB88860.1 hypothetical protein C9928_05355 [Pseudidiomarina aestuarii]